MSKPEIRVCVYLLEDESEEAPVYLALTSWGHAPDTGSSPVAGPDDGNTIPPPRPQTAPASSHTGKTHTYLHTTLYTFYNKAFGD